MDYNYFPEAGIYTGEQVVEVDYGFADWNNPIDVNTDLSGTAYDFTTGEKNVASPHPAPELEGFGGFAEHIETQLNDFDRLVDWDGNAMKAAAPTTDQVEAIFQEFDESFSSPSTFNGSSPHSMNRLTPIMETEDVSPPADTGAPLDAEWLGFLSNITGREEEEADLSFLNPYEKFKIDSLDLDLSGRLVISTRNPYIVPGPRAPSEYAYRKGPASLVDVASSSGSTHKPPNPHDAISVSDATSSFNTASSISTPMTGLSSVSSLGDSSRARMENRRKRKSSRRSRTTGSVASGTTGTSANLRHVGDADKEKGSSKGGVSYPCTFCPETFSGLFNWWRHEDSIHLNSSSYHCAPAGFLVPYTGGPVQLADSTIITPTHECVYCSKLPDFLRMSTDQRIAELTRLYSSFDIHNNLASYNELHISALSDPVQYADVHRRIHRLPLAPESRCTEMFARKESLRQHLEHSHHSTRRDNIEKWKISMLGPNDRFESRCGFCGVEMSSWEERKRHLKMEYMKGRRIAEWKGGWGLSADWMARLQRASLPEVFAAMG